MTNETRATTYLAWDRLSPGYTPAYDPTALNLKFPMVHRRRVHNNTGEIDALVQRALPSGRNTFETQYLHDFQKSISSLNELEDIALILENEAPPTTGKDLVSDFAQHVQQSLRQIQTSVGRQWRAVLMEMAIQITQWQRASRLVACDHDTQAVIDELAYEPHRNWDPSERPEWMLLQLEGNFLIRPQQIDITKRMISPPNGRNTAMQLNMGRGKSSVIVPMVAAAAANNLIFLLTLKAYVKDCFVLDTIFIDVHFGGSHGQEIRSK
ncbi:hypothetical protein LTR93_010774 [Exophiala xenobiotica]|nr:hypothetical protein LTR93_010774 [Exophiala xenobiotica]